MKVFLICPVRNATVEETQAIAEFVGRLEFRGIDVYWPARDTNQDDPTGFRICKDNRLALANADVVYVWWAPESYGSHFDLGMAWALGKQILAANEIKSTTGKSYSNFILDIQPK